VRAVLWILFTLICSNFLFRIAASGVGMRLCNRGRLGLRGRAVVSSYLKDSLNARDYSPRSIAFASLQNTFTVRLSGVLIPFVRVELVKRFLDFTACANF
jgi:hypothetical protein